MLHGRVSKVALTALTLLVACRPPPRHSAEVANGTAAAACLGRPPVSRFVSEAQEEVHVCEFGGGLLCLADRCAVYEVLGRVDKERWEYLPRGGTRKMVARYEYFVRDKSGREPASRQLAVLGEKGDPR